MKRTFTVILFVFLFVGALSLTLFTRVEKANAEVADGNRAFAAQDYEAALQHYNKAQTQSIGEAEPLYNTASVYYRQQAMDQAQQSLEQALAQPDKTIEESIHYNLGNVAFQAQQFDAAITRYESALRIDPTDQEAKYNLELALLQQQNQQNQQQQNQQDQQQEQQNQDQNQQDQRQNQQGQQNQQSQQSQEDQQNQQEQQQNQQGQKGQQQKQRGQQGQQQDQQNQQNQQGQQDQQNQQGQQGQQGQQPNPQGQQPGQSDPANGQAAGGQPQQGLTPEQARQLLAAIAGDSQSLLEKLQLYYNIQGSTPEKDW
jgi:Ca-activated chloride channel homolog